MKFKLKGRPVAPANVEGLEREIGRRLPEDFLEFVNEHDGAEPETNIFTIDGVNESGVNGFIPLREVLAERKHIENLPTTAFPIAWAEGGNYVFLDVAAGGAILFRDHEQPTPLVQLAPNFKAFIDKLDVFDPNSVTLKPGQVKSAWIDPDFLKGLDQ